MKNSVYNVILILLAKCLLFLAFVACSEPSTAGATVDDNSVAGISADEKAILEHRVDSTKMVTGFAPADTDDYETDSTRFWYEIIFGSEHDVYFSYVEDYPYFDCFVDVYRLEYGVRSVNNFGIGNFFQHTLFLTANEQGIIYHEKWDYHYIDSAGCENDFLELEKNCKNGGGDLFSNFVSCQSGELHLTCSMSRGHLSGSVESILNDYAEKMKTRCLENR